MGTVRYTTVNPAVTSAGLGSSDTAHLKRQFPNSPIGKGIMVDDGSATAVSLRGAFQQLCMVGKVIENIGNNNPPDSPYAPNDFSRDYFQNGAPHYRNVPTGGEGLPASAFVPNPASSPTGLPSDQPAAPPGFGLEPRNEGYGSGPNATKRSPNISSFIISLNVLSTYQKGSSTPGTSG